MEQLAEAVQIVKAMFTGRCVFVGRHYRADGAFCHPLPIQRPGPPVWVARTREAIVCSTWSPATPMAGHGLGVDSR